MAARRRGGELPALVVKRLWKIPRRDPAKHYTKLGESPGVIAVLENGSRIIHRHEVVPNDRAQYEIDGDGWLVEKTWPRAEVRAARAAVARKQVAAARAAATRAPAFKAFVAELEAAFGAPTKVRACGVSMLAFAPRARTRDAAATKCHPWIDRAPAAGAAATAYYREREVELRVLAGSPARLAALVGERWWGSGLVEPALDRLHQDAGVSFDFITSDERFWLRLDRKPTDIDAHARALADAFEASPKPIAAALRAKLWRFE